MNRILAHRYARHISRNRSSEYDGRLAQNLAKNSLCLWFYVSTSASQVDSDYLVEQLPSMTELEVIDISGPHLSYLTIHDLSNLTNLRRFSLSDTSGILYMPKLPDDIETIELSNVDIHFDETYGWPPGLHTLSLINLTATRIPNLPPNLHKLVIDIHGLELPDSLRELHIFPNDVDDDISYILEDPEWHLDYEDNSAPYVFRRSR